VVSVCAIDSQSRETVQEILQNKVSFIGGKTGTGKSTLINLIDPHLKLRTGEISQSTLRGKHTTTNAEMYFLSCGGKVIDAPGLSDFEITGFELSEISGYFLEFRPLLANCRFSNCLHESEPNCAIKLAVEQSLISPTRYHTYLGMLAETREQLANKQF
ncbi:MAG: ribosome small subunit-dependent GTPase A, partial [Bacteroidia bacterium]|nr:ribosome small subunit-dependent GTPase A [Bacteroidia bacterium]